MQRLENENTLWPTIISIEDGEGVQEHKMKKKK